MYKKYIYIFILSCTIFFSCSKESLKNDTIIGREYFPLKTGNTLIYKIVEIKIDKPSNYYDTSIYYLKEVVDIALKDNEGDTVYRIERYKKDNELKKWDIYRIWSAKLTNFSAEKIEENQRFVKIKFPVKLNYNWNGNVFNNLKNQKYRISKINHNFNNGFQNLDSCITIIQDSSISLIHKNIASEIYCSGIGLVYKEKTYINSQEIFPGIPIEDRITTGTIFKQELIVIENILK